MPSLRIRRDGQPYVIASYRDEDEATGFSTWYPDLFAIGQFQAIGIDEGGSFDWELFHELRKGGHLVLGNEGIPRRNIAEVETFRSLDAEIQAYFRYIREEPSPDYGNLGNLFRACLWQVQRAGDHAVRESQFFSVAEGVKGLVESGVSDPAKRKFGKECRNRLIRRTPDHLSERIRKYFGLGEDSWNLIRSASSSMSIQEPVEPSPVSEVDAAVEDLPLPEITCRTGGLDRLEELLRYAYGQSLINGNDVEIEVRVKRK
jgi:hypothetical protein